MTRARSETDMHEALYKLACDYPEIPGTKVKGINALAQIMGMSANTLRNKLSPDVDTHKASFEEVAAIMEICAQAGMKDPYTPLRALNGRLGFSAHPVDDEEHISDEAIGRGAMIVMAHIGDMVGAVGELPSNDQITHLHVEKVEAKSRKAVAAILGFVARIKGRMKGDPSKPRKSFFGKGKVTA